MRRVVADNLKETGNHSKGYWTRQDTRVFIIFSVMLGQVVAQKRGTGRKKRLASMVPASLNTSVTQSPQTRSSPALPRRTRRAVQDVSNHKITEFFPVRRSGRKTGKQIQEEERNALRDAIYKGTNENFLAVYKDDLKGRGIKAKRSFLKNEFVIEYRGEMLDYSVAKVLEEKYSQDQSIGSYMYFFTYRNKRWCVDATKESVYKGRLINHSYLRPNLRTKVVEFNGVHHLILVAKRDIVEGEELLYDYGDRSPETIAKNPWLTST